MTTIQIADHYSMKGVLTIEAIYDDGTRQTLLSDNNLIVKAGRMALVNALNGNATPDNPAIVDIAFGNTPTPLAPSPDDIHLLSRIPGLISGTDYIFSKKPIGNPAPKLAIAITVPKETTLNGKSISEMALVMNQSSDTEYTAFSIKRFEAIPKSNVFSLLVNWVIYL